QTFSVNAYSTDSLTNGGQIAYLADTYGSQPLSNLQAAGLQIAIWSELYDNGAGFTSGVFQYTPAENANDPNYSTIAGFATEYLNAAQGNSAIATWYDGSPSGDGQWRGQSMVDPAVPAPPSLVLFLVGLGCLGIAARWQRRLRLA
ncbi:MAG TPA: PEP-CTERM sorting domain-containing protein, partial [Gemmataceae bacterium]|nr:PEP-CTERM sorting domain-containing protein [Gemmataceae bacterium]